MAALRQAVVDAVPARPAGEALRPGHVHLHRPTCRRHRGRRAPLLCDQGRDGAGRAAPTVHAATPEGGALAGSGCRDRDALARVLGVRPTTRPSCAHVYGAAADDRRLAAALEARAIALIIAPFAARVPAPDACPRARLACAQLLGLAMSRYVLLQEPLASADHETIAAWAGPALDCSLRGVLGSST